MLQNSYFITLKPLTPFFFGGENTFGEGDNAEFFARSNYLPQQTTILGLLRYELLLQNNLIGTNPSASNWAELIGPASFGRLNGYFTNDFGAIKSISPVFLSNSKQHFICQSMDWSVEKTRDVHGENTELPVPLELSAASANGNCITEGWLTDIPVLRSSSKDYDPKTGIQSFWVSADGKEKKQWNFEKDFPDKREWGNGFFTATQQVGIHRKTKRDRKDQGDFYKKVSYQLVEDFSFAFLAEIDLPPGKIFSSRIVTMGGERSLFSMSVTPAFARFEDLFTAATFNHGRSDKRKAIILTSDAYIEDEIIKKCRFAITESLPFRNITTIQQDKGNYARLRGGVLQKTEELLYLLKRGSILFPSNTGNLISFFNQPAFRTIGYNYFIELI